MTWLSTKSTNYIFRSLVMDFNLLLFSKTNHYMGERIWWGISIHLLDNNLGICLFYGMYVYYTEKKSRIISKVLLEFFKLGNLLLPCILVFISFYVKNCKVTFSPKCVIHWYVTRHYGYLWVLLLPRKVIFRHGSIRPFQVYVAFL